MQQKLKLGIVEREEVGKGNHLRGKKNRNSLSLMQNFLMHMMHKFSSSILESPKHSTHCAADQTKSSLKKKLLKNFLIKRKLSIDDQIAFQKLMSH